MGQRSSLHGERSSIESAVSSIDLSEACGASSTIAPERRQSQLDTSTTMHTFRSDQSVFTDTEGNRTLVNSTTVADLTAIKDVSPPKIEVTESSQSKPKLFRPLSFEESSDIEMAEAAMRGFTYPDDPGRSQDESDHMTSFRHSPNAREENVLRHVNSGYAILRPGTLDAAHTRGSTVP